jgi:hypothetical protein
MQEATQGLQPMSFLPIMLILWISQQHQRPWLLNVQMLLRRAFLESQQQQQQQHQGMLQQDPA